MDTLTPLERAALSALVELSPTGGDELREQLATCRVASRQSNAAGFMSTLHVDRSLPAAVESARLGGVGATIPGLEGDAGFAVSLSDRYLDTLEGFAYLTWPHGEDRWVKVDQFEIYLNRPGKLGGPSV